MQRYIFPISDRHLAGYVPRGDKATVSFVYEYNMYVRYTLLWCCLEYIAVNPFRAALPLREQITWK